ncbi:MAG: zinc ribbon domain-containing protein, partial [Halobacteriaceae archaeon]
MGLFRDLGKRAERFRQEAQRAAEEEASHVCAACGELYYTPTETCSECGSDRVVPREDDDGAEASADDDDGAEASVDDDDGDEASADDDDGAEASADDDDGDEASADDDG